MLTKISRLYTKLFALWVAVGAAAQKRTLAIEVGMQNAGLGVVLALKHLGQTAAIPAAIFVFVCIITAAMMAAFWQRKNPQGTSEPVPGGGL